MAHDACSRLPQEILDAIIDIVGVTSPRSEAFKDLISCSLVSRRFLPRTRHFLFEAIYLSTPEEILSYHDMCLKNPIIPASARTLILDTRKLISNTFNDSPLISILQVTTNIETIAFHNVSWEELSPGLLCALSRYPLKNLLLRNFTISSVSSFHSFIRNSATRSLGRLGLYGSLKVLGSDDGDGGTEELAPAPTRPVLVKSLSVACSQKFQDTASTILFSPLSPFNFVGLIDTEVALCQDADHDTPLPAQDAICVLRDIVSASDPLVLAHINIWRSFQRAPPPSLLYLPSLRTLGFLLNNASESLGFQPISVLQWWIDVMMHSECYSLSTLSITAIAARQRWITDKDALTQWRRLDRELSSSRYDVQSVCIIFREDYFKRGCCRYGTIDSTKPEATLCFLCKQSSN
ncbi:uncharacterized protein EV420DRAFT_513749 [Desarmillaria tabescens]|uniref:F-box domain-containing protein n=1 Tax=Armillaria tabescens TaxID=1929756 RepID=A0AA39KCA9_ARMTA|nr:uncharacterized protein EV420DRAFT_513749 [Desarmillaria tabescens]KAK0457226.1 hypothetical protein EV420DRAFT_513749 [Desarmillaria tabescens]